MGFTVSIIAKPYVKRFIEVNCGKPADLSKLPFLKDKFNQALKRPRKRRDNYYSKFDMVTYNSILEIKIKDDEFYRYGWEMSRAEMVAFNRMTEKYMKMFARSYISIAYSFGVSVKQAIIWIQEKLQITEDEWSYEAIKKDFYRHGEHRKCEIRGNLQHAVNETFTKLFLDTQSQHGTI